MVTTDEKNSGEEKKNSGEERTGPITTQTENQPALSDAGPNVGDVGGQGGSDLGEAGGGEREAIKAAEQRWNADEGTRASGIRNTGSGMGETKIRSMGGTIGGPPIKGGVGAVTPDTSALPEPAGEDKEPEGEEEEDV